MKRYYLITTDHLTDRLWFRDDEDFRVAMNYVAIAAFLSGVLVLAFILMSNHVHFVASGSQEKVLLFINKFKQLYAAHYRRKYGVCVNSFAATVSISGRFGMTMSPSSGLSLM